MMATTGDGGAARYVEAATACACTRFRRASRAVTQRFDEALEPCGLRSTQLAILLSVAAMAPTTVATLSRDLVMDSSTVNRNLKPLIARGLVDRGVPAGRGRRRLSLSVTAKGQAVLTEALPLWRGVQESFLSALGAEHWPGLREGLDSAVEAARGGRGA